MRIPGATYRVQLNKDFRFADARELLPYLERIGITDLYASPVFQARKGSMHGYDVVDPNRVNPELGTLGDFDALVEDLHRRGMHLLLDIVPNHMAASPQNPWWMDVIENGSASPYASFFDVEWGHRSPTVKDKIVLPILGEPYGTALEDQKLHLSLSKTGLCINYYESGLPIDPATYHDVLSYRLDEFLRNMQRDDPALHEFGMLLEMAERLPGRSSTDWEAVELRRRESTVMKEKLWALYQSEPSIREFLDENLRWLNGSKGNSSSFDRLDALLNQQPYQLMFWRAARERINYRRFFDVTDLIGIRAQDAQVFQATHDLLLRWVEDRKVAGLRIDHVDGLYDPLAYLAHLQALASRAAREPVYIAVEKIVSGPEHLPSEWPVAGITGYDFLGMVNNLFVHPEGLKALTSVYAKIIGKEVNFYEIAYAQKKRVIEDLFAGEIRTLGLRLNGIAERYRHARDLSPQMLSRALLECTASMPVYRTYVRDFHIGAHDTAVIEDAVASARRRNPSLSPACFDFVRQLLLLQLRDDEEALRFVMRWQQLTGPVMAKGVEDTTFYLYNRLVSTNDVGGSPEAVSIQQFHSFNSERRQQWPGTMNATSTHDTKRSEDVRARINLLSEMPAEWEKYVNRWRRWNQSFTGSDFAELDPNQEYLLYQTLVGAWPLDDVITQDFVERIKNYMVKAAREAKVHTSWLHQRNEYEGKMLAFTEAILREGDGNRFLAHFRGFQKRLAYYGAISSLAQTLLKVVCPGTPDFYQGTTLWDFSLVDPDNRRPAQIAPRLELLQEFVHWAGTVPARTITRLLECWMDGRLKAFVIFKSLQFRKDRQDLFENGEYIGLTGAGLAEEHTVAVARKRANEWVIGIVPRFVTGLSALEKMPLGRRTWKDAAIVLPDDAPRRWRNVFTGEEIMASGVLPMAEVLKSFPVALLSSVD